MRLTLAPKSQSAPSICTSPMQQGIEKSPRSCSLTGDCKNELHTRPIGITNHPLGSPFLERKSLTNCKQAGAFLRASKKGVFA